MKDRARIACLVAQFNRLTDRDKDMTLAIAGAMQERAGSGRGEPSSGLPEGREENFRRGKGKGRFLGRR